jgi:hypothetical protein
MQLGSAPFARHLDFAGLVGIGVLRRVRDKLVDQEAKRNCLVSRNHQVVEVAVYPVGERFLQLPAKLAREIGDVDKPDPGAAPQVIVNLGDRGNAGSGTEFITDASMKLDLRHGAPRDEPAECVQKYLAPAMQSDLMHFVEGPIH